MFDYFSKPKKKHFGFIDYDSFLLCTPGKDYKINANISIIKGETPILFDIGLSRSMLYLVEKALRYINKEPKNLKIIISHYHPDHILNLCFLKFYIPNCQIIWHERAYQNLIRFSKYKVENLKYYNKRIEKLFTNSWQLFISTFITKFNINYVCKDNDFIPVSDLKLKVIHTPGHSPGHICLHDCTNKILFLGDHVPLTPWLDISYTAVDDMINSINKLLRLSSKEVKYSVRGHGNLKDNWNEVYPWEQEKARFEEYLELILTSLDKIEYLLNKKPMNVDELASHILKNKDFRDYSSFLNKIFMPPNISWVICYLLKLKKENRIKQKGRNWITV